MPVSQMVSKGKRSRNNGELNTEQTSGSSLSSEQTQMGSGPAF